MTQSDQHAGSSTTVAFGQMLSDSPASEYLVYVAMAASSFGPGGVARATFDLTTGTLNDLEAVEGTSSSYLAVHPTMSVIYAARHNDDFIGGKIGSVTALVENPILGGLKVLSEHPSLGIGPCFLSVDESGRFLLVANYGGTSVALMPINQDGSVGPVCSFDAHEGAGPCPKRQTRAFAHCIRPMCVGDYVVATNLGNDRIYLYRRTNENTLKPIRSTECRPGSGPRHIACHPTLPIIYVSNELSNTVAIYALDLDGAGLAKLGEMSTLPQGHRGVSTAAEIAVHASGRWVYCSNRGHNSIAMFDVLDSGALAHGRFVDAGGECPRHFAIDPTGRTLVVCNQRSNSIASFEINSGTGELNPTGRVVWVSQPMCVQFAPKSI